MSTSTVHNLIIVGSGPAGYTAGLYAGRAQLGPVLFEGSQFGGELMNTTEVENYPGFAEGIMGPDLMEQMREQAMRFGADVRTEDVDEVDLSGPIKTVSVGGEVYRARALVLAMGASARYLDIPGEQKLLGRGVSSCATCDGFFFRDQHIAVVGGGDSALEEATFLTRFASKVTLIHRRQELRASQAMQDRAAADEKLEYVLDSEVTEIHGEDSLTGLTVRNTVSGETSELPVTGLFVAIGSDPRTSLFGDQLSLRPDGYLNVEGRTSKTAAEGVFAAGDVIDSVYRQAITAAGSGCSAALDAEHYLADLETAEKQADAVSAGASAVAAPVAS